jgi:RND family efflux transporter MFP subunit
VERGAVLLRLDDGPVSAELSEARSKRLALDDSLRQARDELDRVSERATTDERLYRQGALTRSRYQESQAALKSAQAHVSHLEQEVPLSVAALDLRINELAAQKEAATVLAALAGTVYRTEHKLGATVRAGEPVLRIADLESLRVRMNIDQVDLGRVRAGQLVAISSNAYPGRSWSARVSDIVPHVVLRANRAVADGLSPVEPPSEGLVPGMTVDVEVLVEEVAGALQVPARAIFTTAGSPFVYRVEKGRARVTPVSLGRSSATAVEVVEGLEVADLVVIGPANGLRDGDRVDLGSGDERSS